MKINTEIIQKVFVVTCKGTRLDAAFAQKFFISMQGFIKKGHMDIVLDLSSVESVESTELSALVRCLKEINGRRQLVICGVSEMVLSLLKMTRLHTVFTQTATREEAIKRLAVEQKKKPAVENKKKPAAQAPVAKSAVAPSKAKGFDESLLASLKMEDSETVQKVDTNERRKHRRIVNKQIINEDIIVHCTDIGTGLRSTSIVLNICPGGLLLASPSKLTIGREFIIDGRIGEIFKFRERAVIRNGQDGKYGFEFIEPSEKTTSFLHQLTGSVVLTRGQLYQVK